MPTELWMFDNCWPDGVPNPNSLMIVQPVSKLLCNRQDFFCLVQCQVALELIHANRSWQNTINKSTKRNKIRDQRPQPLLELHLVPHTPELICWFVPSEFLQVFVPTMKVLKYRNTARAQLRKGLPRRRKGARTVMKDLSAKRKHSTRST